VIEREIEVRIDVMVRRGRRGKQLLDELLDTGRGNTRSHCLENWKRKH
jgi:hypothetical protein